MVECLSGCVVEVWEANLAELPRNSPHRPLSLKPAQTVLLSSTLNEAVNYVELKGFKASRPLSENLEVQATKLECTNMHT